VLKNWKSKLNWNDYQSGWSSTQKTVMQHNAMKSLHDNWNTLKKKMNFTVVARWHGDPSAHVAQQITSRLIQRTLCLNCNRQLLLLLLLLLTSSWYSNRGIFDTGILRITTYWMFIRKTRVQLKSRAAVSLAAPRDFQRWPTWRSLNT